jgi:hypothetical protein
MSPPERNADPHRSAARFGDVRLLLFPTDADALAGGAD